MKGTGPRIKLGEMMKPASTLTWLQPGWLEETVQWSSTQLREKGAAIIGSIDQFHIRPWSTVVRIPTSRGDVYFKAAAPALAHEAGLTEELSNWRPDCMPEVLGVDRQRGWLLLGDMGVQLRSQMRAPADAIRWKPVLDLYAGLQVEMIARRDELLAAGTMDRRLALLPGMFAHVLEDIAMLRIDLPDGLTSEEYSELRKMIPVFSEMCGRLSTYGIPETLHHDDFHDGNIFLQDGRIIFSDWGESCLAHPFFTMVVNLRSIAYRLKLENDDPEILKIRDHYLNAWLQFGSPAHLLEAYQLATQIGTVCRALTWYRVLVSIDPTEREDNVDAVPGWLQEFLMTTQTNK
jgi:hypothetical protein